jgi:hypothetical protein
MSEDALRAVAARIERGWSQGLDARDAEGRAVHLTSDEARAWTLVGRLRLRPQTASQSITFVGRWLRSPGDRGRLAARVERRSRSQPSSPRRQLLPVSGSGWG